MKNPNQHLIDAERKWYDATQRPESNPTHPGDWSTCQRLDGSTEVRHRHTYLAVYFDDVLTLRRSAGDGLGATVTHFKLTLTENRNDEN